MKLKILLIDDDLKTLTLLSESLAEFGFDVLTASSGEQGIAIAGESTPDLILLDVKMPGIDGWETCRRLKAGPETREIPVVFLTAFSGDKDRTLAAALGAADLITKPVDPDRLVKVFDVVMSPKRAEAAKS
ncbi:MAG: response regulator [Chitinispirillaceae bacterium]|jgi:CheY-like chemotaxis protein|nr:response regulator [Chitinispirillaceae bacterium]